MSCKHGSRGWQVYRFLSNISFSQTSHQYILPDETLDEHVGFKLHLSSRETLCQTFGSGINQIFEYYADYRKSVKRRNQCLIKLGASEVMQRWWDGYVDDAIQIFAKSC